VVTSPREGPVGAAAIPVGRFPKRERVRKRREYLEIQALGRRVTLSHFVMIVRARVPDASSVARLGITASRKVGNSAVRSRARRLVREAFRATRELFPGDADVVVIVKRAPKTLGLAEVVAEFRGARSVLAKRIDEARRELNTKRDEA
jgi:ribonuclease P protein component